MKKSIIQAMLVVCIAAVAAPSFGQSRYDRDDDRDRRIQRDHDRHVLNFDVDSLIHHRRDVGLSDRQVRHIKDIQHDTIDSFHDLRRRGYRGEEYNIRVDRLKEEERVRVWDLLDDGQRRRVRDYVDRDGHWRDHR